MSGVQGRSNCAGVDNLIVPNSAAEAAPSRNFAEVKRAFPDCSPWLGYHHLPCPYFTGWHGAIEWPGMALSDPRCIPCRSVVFGSL